MAFGVAYIVQSIVVHSNYGTINCPVKTKQPTNGPWIHCGDENPHFADFPTF